MSATNTLLDDVWSIVSAHLPEEQKAEVAIDLIDAFDDAGVEDLNETVAWLYASGDDWFVLGDLVEDLDAGMTRDEFTDLLDEYDYDFDDDRVTGLFNRIGEFLNTLERMEAELEVQGEG